MTQTLTFNKAHAAALIVAPANARDSVEAAGFSTSTGERIVCNADIRPYSPIDGTHMQVLSSGRQKFTAAEIRHSFVDVGTCNACSSRHIATASFADQLEEANVDFHCLMCSSLVTPTVDNATLVQALAAEYAGDDYEDDEAGDDAGDDSAGPYADEDEDEEGMDDDTPEDEDDYSDGDDDGDADADVDNVTDYDDNGDDGETASVDDDPAPEMDGQDPEDAENHFDDSDATTTAAFLRALGADEDDNVDEENMDGDDTADDGYEDEGDDEEPAEDTQDEDEEDSTEEGSFNMAVAALRAEMRKLGIEVSNGDCDDDDIPSAGRPSRNDSIDEMNASAKRMLRERRGSRPDGSGHLKSFRARAAIGDNALSLDDNIEGDDTFEDDDMTPGTYDGPIDDSNMQDDAPGTFDTMGDGENVDGITPGTEEPMEGEENVDEIAPGTDENDPMMSGASVVDWTRATVELLATKANENRLVVANGRPVAILRKNRATKALAAQWGTPVVESAFLAACSRGLLPAEAKEFGFVGYRFKVQASDVMRAAMSRHKRLTAENARSEVARGVERYKQSVRTAMLAALKGTFNDLKNPLRDQLASSLARLGVVEPRGVVDTAFASAVEPLLVGVFARADVLASKSDAARNETAHFVATSSYQARVTDVGADLSARLASQPAAVALTSIAPTARINEVASTGVESVADWTRRALGR